MGQSPGGDAGKADGEALRVVHTTYAWLPRTMVWLYNQLQHLPRSEVENHVVCYRSENLDLFGIPRLHQCRRADGPGPLLQRFLSRAGLHPGRRLLRRVVGRTNPAIVHSHFGNWAWEMLDAVRTCNARHVVTFYGLDVNLVPRSDPRWADRYVRLFAEADRFLCEGPHMMECLVALGCPREKIALQHLGVDLDALAPRPRVLRKGEALRVLVAGSFREKKGIPDAMEALGHLRRRHPAVEVTVIGDAGDGESERREKGRILDAVDRNGLSGVVRFLGYQPWKAMVAEAYGHHVFLSPSVTASDGDTEGGVPVAILEMAATGMPVVTTTHCDIPYGLGGVDNGGFFAPEHAPEVLAEHLSWLAEHPDEWEVRTVCVRSHLERSYDWRVIGGLLLERYREVLRTPPASGR
ncbi:MAG: glycosyltransferase [Pseudomonadota bacterium]